MKLWIVRHSDAGEDLKDPKKDRERQLTSRGKAMAKDVAETMLELDEIPNVIFASPTARTQQTADIFGKVLGTSVDLLDDLSSHLPLEDTIMNIVGHDDLKRVMIVGHHDNLDPCMECLGGDVKWKDLVKAEVRRVEIDRKTGEWKLKWSMCPSEIGYPDLD